MTNNNLYHFFNLDSFRDLQAYHCGDLEREQRAILGYITYLQKSGVSEREIREKVAIGSRVRQLRERRDETFRNLYNNGWSYQQIANRFGCSKSLVYDAVNYKVPSYTRQR